MRTQMAHRQRTIQMQLASAAVVEHAVRNIGLLLDLANRQPSPNRVHRPRRDEKSVSCLGIEPIEHSHDGSVERTGTGLLAGNRLAKPSGDLRARLGL